MPKICRFFSIKDENPDLLDLIVRIVTIYNRAKEKHDPFVPVVQHAELPPFQLTAYVQKTETTTGLAKWVKQLNDKEDLTTRKVDYVFFFYRQIEAPDKTVRSEIFALSSGQAYRVVQKFSDYRFPVQIARRLCAPKPLSSKQRPLVGRVLMYAEILKEGVTVSDTEALDKLFQRVKFGFRPNASIFRIPCFQTSKGKSLSRGMAVEIGLGLVRLSRKISPDGYVQVLQHFSRIAAKEKTTCFPQKKENEVDSEEFDFLEYVHPIDFSLMPQLNKTVKRFVYAAVVNDEEFPAFDFCHKHLSDYFHGDSHQLRYPGSTWNCPNPFSATHMVSMLKGIPALKDAESEEAFFKELDKVTVSFEFQGRREVAAFFDYLEGEVRVKNGGYFWRLRTMWYQVQGDYLSLIHQEFGDLLQATLLDGDAPSSLSHQWPSPDRKKELKKLAVAKHKKACSAKKKCTHRVKYDTEAEYNQSYLLEKNYLLGDKICAHGIELFDILHWDDECVYLYHVKEGFGQKTRDACSQIYQSARQIHTIRQKGATNILQAFYAEATSSTAKGEYRKAARKKMAALKEQPFYDLFKKKVVFVYAFADDAATCRLLSSDKGLKTRVTADGLATAHLQFKKKGKKLFNDLVKAQYLTRKGFLTSKFFATPQKDFSLTDLKVKAQAQKLYKYLSMFTTKFDSTIAKLELLRVRDEVERLGFTFRICQIPRTDYAQESESSDGEGDASEPASESAAKTKAESSESEEDASSSSDETAALKAAETSALPESDDEDFSSQRKDLREGENFTYGNESFHICVTEPDGACALHAILGTKKKGKYIYNDPSPNDAVRRRFVEVLRQQLEENDDAYANCLIHLLKDYLDPRPSTFVRQIFDPVEELNELRAELETVDAQKLSLSQNQERLFATLTQTEDEALQAELEKELKVSFDSIQDDSFNRNRIFRNCLARVVSLSADTDAGGELSENFESIKALEAQRDQLLRDFVVKDEVVVAYTEACQDPDYYFSDAEIELAARLFNKRVKLFGHLAADQVYDPREFGGEEDEEVVMFHRGIHYSRCERVEE
jgi:hypothetical protein